MIIDGNRRQSLPVQNTNIFVIDWSLISDIDRLIVIDCYRLLAIVIDYRFHGLIRPGNMHRIGDDNFGDGNFQEYHLRTIMSDKKCIEASGQ